MQNDPLIAQSLGERRHDLDWLRVIAFGLLILYHTGMYYVTWDWHVKSPHASSLIEPLMKITEPWRMLLLFLVSGVATGYLLARDASRHFLAQRSLRLVLPLLFGVLVIVPPQSYLEVVEKIQYTGSYLDFLGKYYTGYGGFCRGADCLFIPTWNHLWFLAYLWVYTVALHAIVRMLPRSTAALRSLAERWLGGWGIVFWPILYLAILRLTLLDHFPRTNMLVNDWYNHAVYGAVFITGFALAGTHSPWKFLAKQRWRLLGLSVVGWALLCAYMGLFQDPSFSPSTAIRRVMRTVNAAQQWLPILSLLGFAHVNLHRDSPALRFLTSAIFPLYVLHQTVIVVAAHLLKASHLPPGIEGMLLVLFTIAICLLAYEVIRRVPLLRPLFGLSWRARL